MAVVMFHFKKDKPTKKGEKNHAAVVMFHFEKDAEKIKMYLLLSEIIFAPL